MDTLKTEIGKLTLEALSELFFMHPHHTYGYVKQLTALLSQRSCEEINKYLSTQAYKLRMSSGQNRSINPGGLYVVLKDCGDGDSFECSYMLGETYFEPPLILPTDIQIKELWEYCLTVRVSYGFCTFQEFLEKKIAETVSALLAYEEMLDQEIVALEYALLSEQGVSIHNALYTKAQEVRVELRRQGSIFKKTKAPLFIRNDHTRKMKFSERILKILDSSKPRMV